MAVIGFRCFVDGLSYVVLEGSQADPTVIANARLTFPKDLSWSAQLSWCRRQLLEILGQYEVTRAGLKAVENNARQKFLARSEIEGIVKETLYSHSHIECGSRIKSQLKRDISGFDQPARYLERVLTATHLDHLNSGIFQDATLAAIAELPQNA